MNNRTLRILLASILTAAGVAGATASLWWTLDVAKKSARAVPVSATVLEADVRTDVSWRPLGRRVKQSRPAIFYFYEYDGREYEATRRRWFDREWLPRTAEREIAGLSPGQVVTAFVDPREPSDACLHRGVNLPLAAAFLLGPALCLVLGCMALRAALGELPLDFRRCLCVLFTGLGLGLVLLGVGLFQDGESGWQSLLGAVVASLPWLFRKPRRRSPAVRSREDTTATA